MKRVTGWRGALTAYVAGVAAMPFAEGTHDCALFVAGAVAAMTGQDPAAAYRGRYRTTRGGLRILRKQGIADHLELTAELLEEIAPAFAGVGDVAAVWRAGVLALGIVQGERIYVVGPSSVTTVALTDAVRAWRLP